MGFLTGKLKAVGMTQTDWKTEIVNRLFDR